MPSISLPRCMRRRLALWLCRLVEFDPAVFAPRSGNGGVVEVRICGKQVWVNTEDGCQFRATAAKEIVLNWE